MTKRSVDKREKSKKTVNQEPIDKTGPNSIKETTQGRSTQQKNDVWHMSDFYWYAALFATFLFSLFLRIYLPWKGVFQGDKVIFSSETDAWYHMMLAKGTVINLQRLWYDPMTYFPQGTPIHFGPFVSWAITIPSYIFGLGHPTMHTVEVVGAFLPAILGALLIFPVYSIGKELGGKSCGLISALIVTVLPGQLFSRTLLGFTDHHAGEIFFSTLTIAFLILAMRHGKGMTFQSVRKDWSSFKMPLIYSTLSGLSLGFYILDWSSGFLFEGIILGFILIQSIADHLKGVKVDYLSIIGSMTFFIAMLLVLPFVKSYNGFSHYFYSFFHPTILLLGIILVIIVSLISNYSISRDLNKYYYPAFIIALGVIGFGTIYAIIPSFTSAFLAGLNVFQAKTGGAATVGEAAPLLSAQGQFSTLSILSNFPGFANLLILSPFIFALFGLALILLRYRKRQAPSYLLVIIWSLIMLFLTLAQNRFAYYYSVNIALLTGYLAVWGLQKAGLNELEDSISETKSLSKAITSNVKVLIAAVLIFFFLIYPGLSLCVLTAKYTSGPDSDWLTSTAWLQNNTPGTGMELYKIYHYPGKGQEYPYPSEAYGVMSWWDYGHLIETVGHRMPNANPFQMGIGNLTAGVPGSSPFFLAQNESEAEQILASLDENRSRYMNTKYVMIDWDMATGKFYAMTAWSDVPITNFYGFFYQPQGDKLVPVGVYRDPFFKTMTSRLFYFDGSEIPVTDAFAIAYQIAEQNGIQFPVIVEAPKISKNYTELLDYVAASKEKGYFAEIVSKRDPQALTTATPLAALQHYRLIHESENTVTYDGQKFVKTFEHVPGAILKGNAAPLTQVSLALPIMTNRNRAFIYRQSNITDPNGMFTLVVPYSTEGPSLNSTNFDTVPVGPYQIYVGDRTFEVNVPENYVMTGGVINV
ncbi:MAG: oligosaccharyl transferase, archaeosortase A system-associated [Methanotrichaceae archaeon]|nr:oligosaccharyl transferase, archaeosortase A system-associated [Methanotrichaceae archaeon]